MGARFPSEPYSTAAPVGLAVWASMEDADPLALGMRNGRVRGTGTIQMRKGVCACGFCPTLVPLLIGSVPFLTCTEEICKRWIDLLLDHL